VTGKARYGNHSDLFYLYSTRKEKDYLLRMQLNWSNGCRFTCIVCEEKEVVMMEHGMCGMNGGTECDRERYERIWQRVAPSLSPYPPGDYSGSGASAPVPASSQSTLLSEPGAQADPCCMGSAAMEVLAVLEGFIEEELADHRHYMAFVRQAPPAARPKAARSCLSPSAAASSTM
jgi:hypothetical protein